MQHMGGGEENRKENVKQKYFCKNKPFSAF